MSEKGPFNRFKVALICCGHDDGEHLAETWEQADAFREAYLTGGREGHVRHAIITAYREPARD